MRILTSLFTDELAIDLGTVNTLIYAPDRGIVLNEPSAVAINKYTGEVLAVGLEAQKLSGREPHDTNVYRPIRNGTIDNYEVTEKMLKAFIKRISTNHHRRCHMVIGVPGSSTNLEQRSVRDAGRDGKATRVDLIDEGLAAGLGAGLEFEDERAHMVVDIGGGTTNVAIIASGGVVSSLSLSEAGNSMDSSIRDFVRSKHSLQIGERTSELVKKELGAAILDEKGSMGRQTLEIVGKRLADGGAQAITLEATEICEALEPAITGIIDGVRRAIEESQPDVTADIYHTGIILTGGGALLTGLAQRLQSAVGLPVVVADDPLTTVAVGGGRLLNNPVKLQRAAIREDVPVWQASEELVVNW